MKIDGAWQEGEVVERQRARQVYEDYLHRRQDPALLEQEAGNEFSARVFPIPARGRKELIVSYSHAMARADEPYVLPLLGLSKVGQLDVRVLLGGQTKSDAAASNLGGEVSDRRVVELHKQSWTPDRDFEIAQGSAATRAGLRQGNLAVVRVAAPVDPVAQEIAGLYVLVDSSASRALGYATQVRRIGELIAGLRAGAGGSTPVGIAAFDQEVAPIFEGRASGFGEEELQRLNARRPLGASDLEGALAWLGDRLPRNGRKFPRVLLVTDGVATAGETETRALKAAVHALGARGVERLDVLAVGGLRDEAALRELTTGNLAQDGQRIDRLRAPLRDRPPADPRLPLRHSGDDRGRGLGLARDPGRRPAGGRDAGLRRSAGRPAVAPRARRPSRRARRAGVRRAPAARTRLGPGPHRAAAPPARDHSRRRRGPAPRPRAADRRGERQAPGPEPVHRHAGARIRV